jgi:hypothetical protein
MILKIRRNCSTCGPSSRRSKTEAKGLIYLGQEKLLPKYTSMETCSGQEISSILWIYMTILAAVLENLLDF